MSIAIGIYDLFAYTIPGFLYIYVLYGFLSQFEGFKLGLWIPPAIPDGYGLVVFVLFLVLAHLSGHLFDNLAHWFVFRLFSRPHDFSEKALERSKRVHADIDIHFQPKDRGLLFTMLRQRNLEYSHSIDSFEANSIMLRNISLGLFFLAVLQLYLFFVSPGPFSVVAAIGLFVLSYIARKRSHMFHSWFWTDIFESSLRYGSTLQEVITYDHKNRITASSAPAIENQDHAHKETGKEMEENVTRNQ